MKKIEEIILKKDIEFFLNSAIINNKKDLLHIIKNQENANILLYGFEKSHKVKNNIGTNYAPLVEDINYKINLLELLSKGGLRFVDCLKECLNNPKIVKDLINQQKNQKAINESPLTEMNLNELITQEIKNKDLWNFLLGVNNDFDNYVKDQMNLIKNTKKKTDLKF